MTTEEIREALKKFNDGDEIDGPFYVELANAICEKTGEPPDQQWIDPDYQQETVGEGIQDEIGGFLCARTCENEYGIEEEFFSFHKPGSCVRPGSPLPR